MALGSILQGVPEVASASQVAGGFSLGGLGSLLSGASALGSMFGGGDGASANDLAESQLYYGLLGMKHAPYAQVTGLRRAGLNPMLAVSKGFGASPSVGMPSPVDDRQVATARMAAGAQLAAVNSQTALNSAQADYIRAQTDTEKLRPGNVEMDTFLKQSTGNMQEALRTKAQNEGLLVAAQEVQQSLINQINSTGFLSSMKKQELLQMVAKTTVSQADAARARTDEEFFKSEIGKIMRMVQIVLGSVRK